jgi:hypothetical protein
MKRKRLNAMPALLKFLVLLASFPSGSYAHAFTSLSPVAGNQGRVNHLIRFQQPMSNPTNEPSRELIRKPTNDRKKSEPIGSYSQIKRDKSTPTFQLGLLHPSQTTMPYPSMTSLLPNLCSPRSKSLSLNIE